MDDFEAVVGYTQTDAAKEKAVRQQAQKNRFMSKMVLDANIGTKGPQTTEQQHLLA